MRGGVVPVAVGVGLGLCAAAAVALAAPASANTGKSDAATHQHRGARVAAAAQPALSITRPGQSPLRLRSGTTTGPVWAKQSIASCGKSTTAWNACFAPVCF